MVDDLFEMSKINAGAVQPAFDKVALDEVVDDVMAAHRIAAERAGVLLTAELPAEPVRVVGSDRALVRVLSNLVANAIAHTPEGGKVAAGAGRPTRTARGRASTTPASASTRPTCRGCSTWPTGGPTTGCRGRTRRCPAVRGWAWPSRPGLVQAHRGTLSAHNLAPVRGSRCGCRWRSRRAPEQDANCPRSQRQPGCRSLGGQFCECGSAARVVHAATSDTLVFERPFY